MFSIGDDFKNIMDEVKDACKPKMTETNKQTAPDIIEIGGIKYQRVEEPPQPRTLHNILQTYWNVDERRNELIEMLNNLRFIKFESNVQELDDVIEEENETN